MLSPTENGLEKKERNSNFPMLQCMINRSDSLRHEEPFSFSLLGNRGVSKTTYPRFYHLSLGF